MIKIGLTGGIGSGKTTVAKIFETFGIPIYYSDYWAKEITISNKSIKVALIKNFGKDVYLQNGEINKPFLTKLLFKNTETKEKINSIIHPKVAEHFNNWVIIQQQRNAPYIIKETAILFESGAYKQVNKTITVITDKQLRIKRLQERDNSTKEEILNKINNQISDKEKIKLSDFVIFNNKNDMLIPQVGKIHNSLK